MYESFKILQVIPTSTDSNQPDPRKQVETRLRKEWNEPKAKELEFCLQKRVSEDEARHLLFFPTEEQIEGYVTLICDPPVGAPSTHPQHILQIPFISMLYLAHADNWPLCKSFIRAGGLRSLSALLAHKNIYLRSQEWFDAPKDREQKILHSRLLELSQWDFIKNLLLNGPHVEGDHNKIPNASYFCLQILAFWLSWTRKLYSKGGILNLSKELLNTLLKWKENVVIPEEKELITKLYDDFIRFPPAEDMDGHRVKVNKNALNGTNMNNGDSATIVEIEEVEDTRTPAEKADEARTNGNDFFKKKMYTEAIEAYKQAIRHDNTRAAFYANLAAAWLQLSKQFQNEIKKLKNLRVNDGIEEKNSIMVAHANKCIESCKNAIKRDPTYVKAFHRFGQALDIIGKQDEALAKLKEAKKVLQMEIKSKPPKGVLKKLQKLKKSIDTLQADIKERQEAEERASNGWGINNINVNNNLNKKKCRTGKEKKKKSSPAMKDMDDKDGGDSRNNVVDSKVSRIASKLLKRKQFKNV
eukprot:g5453.t1